MIELDVRHWEGVPNVVVLGATVHVPFDGLTARLELDLADGRRVDVKESMMFDAPRAIAG